MNLFVKLLSNGILVQFLTIISTLIFSRLFSVDQFGSLAFYVSFGSLIAVVGGLRFDYLILKENISEKLAGYFISNIISILMNLLIMLIAYAFQSKFDFLSDVNIFILFIFVSFIVEKIVDFANGSSKTSHYLFMEIRARRI